MPQYCRPRLVQCLRGGFGNLGRSPSGLDVSGMRVKPDRPLGNDILDGGHLTFRICHSYSPFLFKGWETEHSDVGVAWGISEQQLR